MIAEASVRAPDADGEERCAAARRVLDRLGDGHVGRRLDRGKLTLRCQLAELHRQRRLVGERLERGRESRLAEDRRIDAVGELAQLVEGGRGLVAGRVQHPGELLVTVGGRAGTREAQVVRQREQPLLGAVVEVALEPAPLGVARLDDPRARHAQIVELGQHLGLQPFVLEREPDGGADLALELGDRRGVRDERDSGGRRGRAG